MALQGRGPRGQSAQPSTFPSSRAGPEGSPQPLQEPRQADHSAHLTGIPWGAGTQLDLSTRLLNDHQHEPLHSLRQRAWQAQGTQAAREAPPYPEESPED